MASRSCASTRGISRSCVSRLCMAWLHENVGCSHPADRLLGRTVCEIDTGATPYWALRDGVDTGLMGNWAAGGDGSAVICARGISRRHGDDGGSHLESTSRRRRGVPGTDGTAPP